MSDINCCFAGECAAPCWLCGSNGGRDQNGPYEMARRSYPNIRAEDMWRTLYDWSRGYVAALTAAKAERGDSE